VFLLLSLLDHTSSEQSNQDGRFDHVDGTQWKQITAGFMTDGNRYHSEYFDFTYSLPDGFVDDTEPYKSRVRALPDGHPDPDWSVLLHAVKRPNKRADPVGEITVNVAYPYWTTEKDFMHSTAKSMVFAGDDVIHEGKQVHVSGWNFFRADYKINRPNSGYLTVVVAFRKGVALLFQFGAHSKKEVDSLARSMPRKLITK